MGTDDEGLPRMPRWYGTEPPSDNDPLSPHKPGPADGHQQAKGPSGNPVPGQIPDETSVPWPEQHDDAEQPGTGQDLGKLSPSEALRTAGQALFARDLIQPGPGWPVGARARERRQQRREVSDLARQRRQQLAQGRGDQQQPIQLTSRWQRVAPSRHARVVLALGGLVAAVAAATWWFTSPDDAATARPPAPGVTPRAPQRPAPPVVGTVLPPQPAIPPGGVAPIVPHSPTRTADAAAVPLAPPPNGPPSTAELASPTSAAQAWLGRWCPFDYREPYGTGQQRSHPAMTSTGWDGFDPASSDQAQRSWQDTVASRETGRCSVPQALISPEAPRSPSSAVVLITAERVVTGPGEAPYVEHVAEARRLTRTPDGLWRVDTATQGG